MQEKTVRVKLFGLLALEKDGKVIEENPARSSLSWMLLKYLLVNRNREVSLDELLNVLWPHKTDIDIEGAVRVRLRRLREALEPLKLDGGKAGLVLYSTGKYRINPAFEIDTDADEFSTYTKLITDETLTPSERLSSCMAAIEIYRGRFLERTVPDAWLTLYRQQYQTSFCSTVKQALRLMQQEKDFSGVALLSARTLSVAAEDEELQSDILKFMFINGLVIEAVNHYTQLTMILTAQGRKPPELTQNDVSVPM